MINPIQDINYCLIKSMKYNKNKKTVGENMIDIGES